MFRTLASCRFENRVSRRLPRASRELQRKSGEQHGQPGGRVLGMGRGTGELARVLLESELSEMKQGCKKHRKPSGGWEAEQARTEGAVS